MRIIRGHTHFIPPTSDTVDCKFCCITPETVNVYDFIDQSQGKASPYGVYDLSKNKGWVSVGLRSDTAKFAVNSIRSWWYEMGVASYPDAHEIYINAEGGGNGSRVRLWKTRITDACKRH